MAVVPLLEVVRGPNVRVDLLHLALNLLPGLHSDGSLVDCIYRPALVPSWDWAGELCAVTLRLSLWLHPICGKESSIVSAYLYFHVWHAGI